MSYDLEGRVGTSGAGTVLFDLSSQYGMFALGYIYVLCIF